MKYQEWFAKILQKISKSKAFKGSILKEPKTLLKDAPKDFPKNVNVKVEEGLETKVSFKDNTLKLIIANGSNKISEDTLDAIAGGGTASLPIKIGSDGKIYFDNASGGEIKTTDGDRLAMLMANDGSMRMVFDTD